jgi:transposase
MGTQQMSGKLTTRRYTVEEKAQAVRLVRQLRTETGQRHGAVKRVAEQLGYGVESVRNWVNQADVDEGTRAGTSSEDAAKIKELEQEVRELRRANEILKKASAFFAAELDRPQKRS